MKYNYNLTVKSNIPSGSWQEMGNELQTDEIPIGKYLIVFSASIAPNESGTGIATINPYIDGNRLAMEHRQTIPITATLLSTGISVVYKNFTNKSRHSINIYEYANLRTNSSALNIKFIKIG